MIVEIIANPSAEEYEKTLPIDLKSTSDKAWFKKEVMEDKDYAERLVPSIWNLVFIFEEMQDELEKNSLTYLTSLGRLSLERWKMVRKIHVLFPSEK